MNIDKFIEILSEYETTDTVFNMYYGDSERAKKCRKRLKKYLEEHKNASVILVGEAPGYNGCAKTGVPFTSDTGEPSSKVIQEFFDKEYSGNSSWVLMWNAFPFHPHEKGDQNTNRKPNAKELLEGELYLKKLLEVFPSIICAGALGKTAEKTLSHIDLEYKPESIRHPAHGGKKECLEGLHYAFMRFGGIIQAEEIMHDVADAAGEKYKEVAYRYLKEHKEEFFDWYGSSDHLEYAYAYWQIKKIDLEKYQKKKK